MEKGGHGGGGILGPGGDGVVSCVERGGHGHETWVRVEKLERTMCGRSRPVFFRGVATFNIVELDVAVFGKEDLQQWRIIRRMVSLVFRFSFVMADDAGGVVVGWTLLNIPLGSLNQFPLGVPSLAAAASLSLATTLKVIIFITLLSSFSAGSHP